jgi:type II secretory pathway pseudopilin PulG
MASRFRFIESVVVVAVIALVTAVLVPAILTAREAARRSTCEYNLKQLSLGLLNYSDVYRSFPPGTSGNRQLPPAARFSWYPSIWYFIQGKPPKLLLDQAQAWNSEVNRFPKIECTIDWNEPTERTEIQPLSSHPLFGCPSARRMPQVLGIEFTHYVGMAGLGLQSPEFDFDQLGIGVWGYDRQTKVSDMIDASSATISLVETNLKPGPWLAGGPPTVRGADVAAVPYIGPGRQFGGLHSGCPAAMLDGSVRHLANATDPAAFAAMTTIAGQD